MSVKKEFIKGTKWTTIQQGVVVVLGLVRLAVLARILQKETFGLFAVTLLLLGLTTIFSDLGISVSLYHKKNITRVQYSTLYWLNLIFNAALYIILILLIPLAIWYFETPELNEIIPIMGLNLIFAAIGKHFQVYAQKELKFKAIAIVTIIANALGLVLAVILAYQGFEIFALVYPTLFISLFGSISYFALMYGEYRLAFVFKFQEVKSFFKVGLFQSAGQIVDFIANQIDIILIPKLLDLESLGVYNLIKQFTMRIYSLVNSVISKVSIPIFSSFNDDETLLKNRYIKLVKKLSLINALLYSGLAFMAYEILDIMYGNDFAKEYLIFAIFCLIFFLSSVASLAGILVVSKGKTQYGLYWTLFRVVVSLPLIYFLGKEYDLIGVVFGLLLFAIQAVYSYWQFLIKRVQTNISFRDHLSSFAESLFMGLILFSSSYLLSQFIPTNLSFVLVLILKVCIFAFIAAGYLFFFRKKDMNEVLALFNLKYRF